MKSKLELVNISVLNVGYAKTQHRWGGTDISSPFARLYYVTAGKATLHFNNADIELKPGYMYLVPSFMPHSYICEPGFEFYYMFVYERYGDSTGFFDIYSFPYEVKANEAAELLFVNYCQLYPQLSLPYSSAEDFNDHPAYRDYASRYRLMERYEKMQLQGFVWIVASYFMKHAHKRSENTDERVLKVCEYVKKHIGEELTLETLADVACVTRSHLGRLFRSAFDLSPIQYVIRSKVQYAQGLLLTTNMSVRNVAEQVGIDDVSYFIRLFKKNIGFTPLDYRERLKY